MIDRASTGGPAADSGTTPASPVAGRSPAPVRPALARWAALAGLLANLWLVATFFLNWSWQAQLGSVAPVGLVWFVGWWRWQRELDRHEVAALLHRIAHERDVTAHFDAELERGRPADCLLSAEDWCFETRYQLRRAGERRAEAEALLAGVRAEAALGWWQRMRRGQAA